MKFSIGFSLFNKRKLPPKIKLISPMCDYTPPDLITLLVTDQGIFTPSVVSDELMKLFIMEWYSKINFEKLKILNLEQLFKGLFYN